jgi:hypothetical protein
MVLNMQNWGLWGPTGLVRFGGMCVGRESLCKDLREKSTPEFRVRTVGEGAVFLGHTYIRCSLLVWKWKPLRQTFIVHIERIVHIKIHVLPRCTDTRHVDNLRAFALEQGNTRNDPSVIWTGRLCRSSVTEDALKVVYVAQT